MRRPVRPVKSKTPEIEELSRQVCDLEREFAPFYSGVLVDVVINTNPAEKRVHHKLGRLPEGWLLLRLVAENPTDFVEKPGLTGSQYMTFESSLPCTAKVWIF